jgi:predicted flap endonuclease-1-like 5' DNA nuclease
VLASKVVQMTSLETERDRLRTRVAERDQRIRTLEQQLAERDTEIARLKSDLAEALARTSKVEDDLTRIKGIGPKFAAALQQLGVVTYAEIAAWTEADIVRIADQLRVPPSRIERAGWIESARALVHDAR